MVRFSVYGVLASLLIGGCTSAAPSDRTPPPEQRELTFLDDPSGPLPETLAELGLYPDPLDLERAHPRALAYEPGYPLWSNGSHKRRYLVLPPGTSAESGEPGAFGFPVGTLFLKTFSYPAPDGGAERPIETRVLSNGEDGWQYAVYLWDDAGGASTIDLARSTKVEVELDGERFEHVVPSKLDCRKCHESGLGPVIGFREIQLGADREGTSELSRLAELGVFGDEASFEPERIEHEDPVALAVLGYLQGNCVHCHNGGAPPAAFDMRHDVAFENLIGKETQGELLSGTRVVPGDPESSVVYLTLGRRTEIEGILPMPPVGVQRTDTSAVDLFRGWIANLTPLENDDD
jgi:hypothetical protein